MTPLPVTVCYLNALVSVFFSVYAVAALDSFVVGTQYMQVAFMSFVVLLLATPLDCRKQRWALMFASVVLSAYWFYAVLHREPANYLAYASGIIFLGGMLAGAFVVDDAHDVELDVILYLSSLNATCYFSLSDPLYKLHMILDIKTLVMLYSALKRPKKKTDLLRSPSLALSIVLITASFVIVESGSVSHHVAMTCMFILYIPVGLLVAGEAALVRFAEVAAARQSDADGKATGPLLGVQGGA